MTVDISSFKRTVAPGLPFTVASGRMQMKNEDENYDDSLIELLIAAAAQMAEARTGRAFMQSTWVWKGNNWQYDSNDIFKLYPGPLVSISQIQYYPADGGAIQTLNTSLYRAHTSPVPGYVEFLDDLPDVDDRADAVQITFVAGYGANGNTAAQQQTALEDEIPDVLNWMKMQMTTLYEYRQTLLNGGQVANISTFADSLIYPYVIF